MNILRIAILLFSLGVFVITALIIRNDPKNLNPLATVLFCLSMATLIVFDW